VENGNSRFPQSNLDPPGLRCDAKVFIDTKEVRLLVKGMDALSKWSPARV